MLRLFILSTFISAFSFAQKMDSQFYSIDSLGDQYTVENINDAVEKADMCGFFYENSRRKMIFDDGTVLFLESASGSNSIEDTCAVENNKNDDKEYWEISDSGHLIRRIKEESKTIDK
ncbi:MAG: hypothetical protein WED10_02700 [Brumimicrobium sp.]